MNARKQAEFYTAYAEMLEPDRRARPSRRLRSRYPRLGTRPRDDGGDRENGDAWVGMVYPRGHWAGPAALASSYRLAAQYAALVDPGWATKLAARAAMAYVSSGLPFGLFLAVGVLDDEMLDDRARQAIVEPFRNPEASSAVRHPVQQAYLLLAAGSRPWLRDPLRRTLDGAERRLTAHALYPIGPQGVPLGDYVDLALAMRYGDEPARRSRDTVPAAQIARRLAGLQRTQATALRAAQRNRFLWQHSASVIDLENTALCGLALRHRRWFYEMSAAVRDELARDDLLADLPLWTMGQVETSLPRVADSVTDIVHEPERAWRREEFREPDTETDPWGEEATRTEETKFGVARWADEETRPPAVSTWPDFPASRQDDAAPDRRPGTDADTRPYPRGAQFPGPPPARGDADNANDEDEGDEGDDPYTWDR